MSLGSFLDNTLPAAPVDLGTLGVTDEYLADLAASEFALIAPRDQDGASGEDGVFDQSDRFTITSALTDFVAQGVARGDLLAVFQGRADSARVRGLFVVAAVSAHSATLTARGPRVGFGAPPGAPGGEANVRFRVPTARPQVAVSAAKYRRRFRVLGPADVKFPSDFVPVVAFDVLVDLYTLAARQAGDETRDSLIAKAKLFQAERDAELKILDGIYGVDPEGTGTTPTPIVPATLTVRTSGGRRGRSEF